MEDLKWWQHIYRSIRYGKFDCGKTWMGGPKFGLYCAFYDSWNWSFYCCGFYISCSGYF